MAGPAEPARIGLADETMLADIADLGRVRPYLVAPGRDVALSKPARGFAKAMGFPAYQFLSPTYLLRDRVEDLRRIGGEEMGHRPDAVQDWPG